MNRLLVSIFSPSKAVKGIASRASNVSKTVEQKASKAVENVFISDGVPDNVREFLLPITENISKLAAKNKLKVVFDHNITDITDCHCSFEGLIAMQQMLSREAKQSVKMTLINKQGGTRYFNNLNLYNVETQKLDPEKIYNCFTPEGMRYACGDAYFLPNELREFKRMQRFRH